MANEQAKAFVDQATQSLQNSQFQQALELVDQAIAIEPGASDSHVLRGICLSQLGQPDAATEALRKAIMLSPYNAKAYYNLAVHQNALGNKKEACELAREAVGVDPRHAAAKQFLAQLETELMRPPPGATGVGPDSASMYDPLSPQPPAPTARPGSQDLHSPTARPGNQDLPPQATSDMPHVSAAPGQARPPAPGAPATPTGNPYAQQSGSQFSAAGFQRAGYDQPAHSLPWVGNMGTGWTAAGWVLSGLSFLMVVLIVATMFSTFQALFAAGGAPTASTRGTFASNPLVIVEIFLRVCCLLWMLFDVVDRRAGWGWVVGLVILGCCCGFPWIIVPIYLIGGRKIL